MEENYVMKGTKRIREVVFLCDNCGENLYKSKAYPEIEYKHFLKLDIDNLQEFEDSRKRKQIEAA